MVNGGGGLRFATSCARGFAMVRSLQEARDFFQKLINQGFFDHPVQNFEICESHLGFVFLTGPYAYKLRKSVAIEGLVDYSTPENRRHFLSLELQLNKELGHDIYRRLITVHIDSEGDDYLLQMRQMPKNSLLWQHLAAENTLSAVQIKDLALTISSFHSQARKIPKADLKFMRERVDFVADYLKKNLPGKKPETILFKLYERFEKNSDLFLKRADRGFVREIHGDCRSENIFFAENKFYLFDRLEFLLAYRLQDVACDIAALSVDFLYFGQKDSRQNFIQAYQETEAGKGLETVLPFYELFWALVIAYVQLSLQLQHPSDPINEERQKKLDRYLEIAAQI